MNSLILARRPNQPFTQEEIGAAAGCSHQNVSLIINQALGKLREKLSTKEIDETGEVRDGAQGFRDFLMEIEGQSQCDIL